MRSWKAISISHQPKSSNKQHQPLYHGPLNWILSYMLGQPVRTLEEAATSEAYAVTKGKPGKYYRLDEDDTPTPLERWNRIWLAAFGRIQ
jgi:hypothetical protein